MVTIIFESHTTTTDNENKIASGWYDVELSALGTLQAQELGQRRQNEKFDAIFCSDLKRSYETGKIAFTDRGIPIMKDFRLRECNYGDFTRKPSAEIEKEKVNRVNTPFPNGESFEIAAFRMQSFLQSLRENYRGKKVMIIGHRATQYGLEYWVNGVPLAEAVAAPWQWQAGWTYEMEYLQNPDNLVR